MTREAHRTWVICQSCRRTFLWLVTVGFFMALVCPRCDEPERGQS